MVNRIIYILCLLVFAGCVRDDDDAGSDGATVPVTFSVAGISVSADTRTGETISSGTLFEIVVCSNATPTVVSKSGEYSANGSGALTGTTMTLAAGNYDFHIYRKSGTRTGTTVTGIGHGVDFYVGKKTVDITTTPVVDFGELTRLCSKLAFTITCASGKSFTMNSITTNNIAAGPATFALGTTTLTGVGTANGTRELCGSGSFTGNGTTSVTASTIVLPASIAASYTLTFNASIDGGAVADYTATLSTPTAFEEGKLYNYTVSLTDVAEITLQVKTNWSDGTIGDITIGQYKLSVSQSEFNFTGEARTVSSTDNTLSVTSIYPEAWKVEKIVDNTGSAITQPGGWLEVVKADGGEFIEGTKNGTTEVKLIVDENLASMGGVTRTGYIHLRVGKLTYIVKVIQTAV